VRFPRFSIAEIMALVAVVALDCVAIRVGSPMTLYCLVFGGLPMQGALLISLMPVIRRQRRLERQVPFLTGFVAIGWVCHLAFVAICVQASDALTWHLTNTLTPVIRAIGTQRFSVADYICRFGIGMIYLTVPQLIPALVAGGICHWWRTQTPPDLPPSHE
jgi:hypothetical protein